MATRALEGLPLAEREVVVARIWGGLSFEEIAGLTGAVDQHGPSPLPGGAGRFARKVGIA